MKQEMEAALVFAILMQDIEDKSPGYLMEKYLSTKAYEHPHMLLDGDNMKIFKDWMKTWHVEEK
jgi:hypothetical protein